MLPDDYDLPPYHGPTVELVVHYPPEQEEQALLFARRLFAELDVRIGALTLVPRDGELHEVWLEGEQVHASVDPPSALRTAELAWRTLRTDVRLTEQPPVSDN